MHRALLILAFSMMVNNAHSETTAALQFVELQVGGAMRIVGTSSSEAPATTRNRSSGLLTDSLMPWRKLLNDEGSAIDEVDLSDYQRSGMSYAFTRSLSFGVGYYLMEAEDFAEEIVMVSDEDLENKSHNVFLRARWHLDEFF